MLTSHTNITSITPNQNENITPNQNMTPIITTNQEIYFPNEIYQKILSYITDYKILQNCRLVSHDFKFLTSLATKIKCENTLVYSYIFKLYPKVIYFNLPLNIQPDIYGSNLTYPDINKLRTLYMKFNGDLLNLLNFIEEKILNGVTLKIKTKESLYWFSLNNFAKISLHPYFNNVDEQLLDVCRTQNVYTNIGTSRLRFPVVNYYLCCHPKTLRSIDFIAPDNVSAYVYTPVSEWSSGYPLQRPFEKDPIKFFNFSIFKSNVLETYDFPVREQDLDKLKFCYPNTTNYTLYNGDTLIRRNKTISLSEKNLPSAESQIDLFFNL